MAVTRRRTYPRKRSSRSKVRPSMVRRRGQYKRYSRPRVSRGISSIFPNGKLVRHKYVDTITMPAVGGGFPGLPSVYTFRSNSMFDPDFTSTGHQPLYTEQCEAIYNYYTVMSSTIKILIPNESSVPQYMGVFHDDITNPIQTQTSSAIMENHKYSRAIRLDKLNNTNRLSAWYNGPRWQKVSKTAFMATNKTLIGNNPSLGAYFVIWRSPFDTAGTLASMNVQVELEYICCWRDPKLIPQS